MILFLRLIFIAFFFEIFQVFALGAHGVTALELSIIGFILIFFKRIIWDGDTLVFRVNGALIFIFLLILASLISGITPLLNGSPVQIVQYFKSTFHLIVLIILTLVFALYPLDMKQINSLIKLWLVCSLIVNVFGIYQIFARTFELPFAWLPVTNISVGGERGNVSYDFVNQLSLRFGNFFRATSIFAEPSGLAAFNLMIISFLLPPLFQSKGHFFKSKIFIYILIFFSFITLFLTFSLGGLATLSIMLFFMIIFNLGKKLKPLIIILISAALLIAATDAIIQTYMDIRVSDLFSERISGIVQSGMNERAYIGMAGESFFGRVNSFFKSLEAWMLSPLIGLGVGLTQYSKVEIVFSEIGALAVLTETGLLGFAAFAGIYTGFIFNALTYLRYKFRFEGYPDMLHRLNSIYFYFLILTISINFIWGNNFITHATWLPFGVLLAISRINSDFENEPFYSISFMKYPLKTTISNGIKSILKIQAQINNK